MIDPHLMSILVCPVSKAELVHHAETGELWCRASGLAYPIRDGVPVMLEHEARELTEPERTSIASMTSSKP